MNESGAIDGIVCIAWGSLVWKPENLPLKADWREGGPALPVEFARQSENKRITLAICPGLPRVPTRWAVLDVPDLYSARRALAIREWALAFKNPSWIEENIGFWDRATDARHGMESEEIAAWAFAQGCSSAVWTNLPCRINGVSHVMPTEDEVINSIRALEGEQRVLAEEYVRKAPREVDTPYRRRIAHEFGWGFGFEAP